MKKRIGLFLFLLLIFILPGCGNDSSSGKTTKKSSNVNDVLEAEMAEEDGKNKSSGQNTGQTADNTADINESERQSGVNADAPEPEPFHKSEADGKNAEGVDVDLTALSSTMVYSEVYNMISMPENYIGKTVKMKGAFATYHDEAADKYYFACIIADATACCSQGIEFVLEGDHTYPDDYPKEGEEICVTGVFDTYQEGGNTFCTLKDARME